MPGRTVVPLVLLAALALAGCSGGGANGKGPASGTPDTAPESTTPVPSTSATPSNATTGSASSTTAAPAGPQTVQKTVQDNSFPDGSFALHVGDTVVWTDQGSNPHSVSGDGFDSHPDCSTLTSALGGCMAKGDTFQHTFDAAGSFAYHCRIHGGMTGTITVS